MGKVNLDRYGSRTPKLMPDDLDGGDFIVLTIAGFDEKTFDDEEGKRVTPVLFFEETGEKVLFLNRTQVGYIVERYGDESDGWQGKHIPIEHHVSTFRGKQHEKLWVMPPERWDEAFEEAGIAVKRPRKVVRKKVAAKRTVKKGGKRK